MTDSVVPYLPENVLIVSETQGNKYKAYNIEEYTYSLTSENSIQKISLLY